jgi:hypothetical protein
MLKKLIIGFTPIKKMRRAEGGAKIVGIFRVKNHDFTPKNHIFPICVNCNIMENVEKL